MVDSKYTTQEPYETPQAYIWRVCSAKDNGLLDLSWEEVADIINKTLYGDDKSLYLSSSAYRKPYQNAKLFYDEVFIKELDSDDIGTKKYLEQKFELEELKKQIQTEKIELNRWLREDARDKLLLEQITQAIKTTNQNKSNVIKPTKRVIHHNNRSHLLLFGDAHFGSEFIIRGLCGEILNEYNPDIFYNRMNILLNEVINYITINKVEHIHIFDLGDSIDGILRVSQLMTLRYGVIESSIKYAQFLADWLNILSEYVNIDFQMCYGNHSELRMINQPKGTFVNDNMGYVIEEIIKIKLSENPNIVIDNSNLKGIIFREDIQGYSILAYHGECKNMESAIKNLSKSYKVDIDILIAGHLHHSYSEAVGFASDVMRTPSLVGVDDFSMKLNKTSDAGATIIAIEKDKGKILDYHIKLK